MNYRHAYHAGNFADVLKHVVLAMVLEHLKRKPTPFRVIDTHAGAGLYALDSGEAARTGEWRQGIGRLVGADALPIPPDVEAFMRPYLATVRELNSDHAIRIYPGSPTLALALMRPNDRLIANELHPEDAMSLRAAIGRDRRAKVLQIDAWQAIRSLLPPKERRGVILIDPPFEAQGDLERLAAGLADGMRRFATGVYLLWLPIKDRAAVERFIGHVVGMGYDELLYAELCVRTFSAQDRLSATAMLIANPPFGLDLGLRVVLKHLAVVLAQGPGASHHLKWLTGGAP